MSHHLPMVIQVKINGANIVFIECQSLFTKDRGFIMSFKIKLIRKGQIAQYTKCIEYVNKQRFQFSVMKGKGI